MRGGAVNSVEEGRDVRIGDRVRQCVVVRLRRNILLPCDVRWGNVGPHARPHVLGPRRARDPPAQRHPRREETVWLETLSLFYLSKILNLFLVIRCFSCFGL